MPDVGFDGGYDHIPWRGRVLISTSHLTHPSSSSVAMNPLGCRLGRELLTLVILCNEHSFRLQDQTADSGANDAAFARGEAQ
jgi:hypothetical protein